MTRAILICREQNNAPMNCQVLQVQETKSSAVEQCEKLPLTCDTRVTCSWSTSSSRMSTSSRRVLTSWNLTSTFSPTSSTRCRSPSFEYLAKQNSVVRWSRGTSAAAAGPPLGGTSSRSMPGDNRTASSPRRCPAFECG